MPAVPVSAPAAAAALAALLAAALLAAALARIHWSTAGRLRPLLRLKTHVDALGAAAVHVRALPFNAGAEGEGADETHVCAWPRALVHQELVRPAHRRRCLGG